MASSCDVLLIVLRGLQARRTVCRSLANLELTLNQSPFGYSRTELSITPPPPSLRCACARSCSNCIPDISYSSSTIPACPIYHEPECELICTICKLLSSHEADTVLIISLLGNPKAPPPDDPSHPSHPPSTSRFARPWFPAQPPTREVTSYQSGGIPTWETAIAGGSGADEEAETQIQNQWETRYKMRVDLLSAWAYILGPITGARCDPHFL